MSNTTSMLIFRNCVDALEAGDMKNINIDDFLDNDIKNPEQCRASVTSILFTYFRNKAVIDNIINSNVTKLKSRQRRVLAICVTQIFFQNAIAPESAVNITIEYASKRYGKATAGFFNAVLRSILKKGLDEYIKTFSPEILSNIPALLYSRWQKDFDPADFESIIKQLNKQPAFTFRLVKEINEQALSNSKCQSLELPDWSAPYKFCVCSEPDKFFTENWIYDGRVYVQDPSTVLAPALAGEIPADSKILDICAAPGGKSICLSEKCPTAHITASDKSEKRQKLTQENFLKYKVNGNVVISPAQENSFKPESFDLILADVPCSNTGVARRRPDALWNFSQAKLTELSELQYKILAEAAKLLKKGGKLIYSTCSIEKEENHILIKKFISEHKDFTLLQEKQLIPSELHDGAYAAVLIKN